MTESLLQRTAHFHVSPEELFAGIARKKGSVWLDSSLNSGEWGRYSIVAANPVRELTLKGDRTRIQLAGGDILEGDSERFLHELDTLAGESTSCAIGYVSYEATLPWLGLRRERSSAAIPEAHFFVYDSSLLYDHTTGQYTDPELAARYLGDESASLDTSGYPLSPPAHVTPSMSRETYLKKVRRIKWHIREGDVYQANLTCRFDVSSQLEPFLVYSRLRRLNRSPYGAYLNFGDYQVLSSSPERMLLLQGNRIQSSPIKGTIRRGNSQHEESINLTNLLESGKDRAELLMIVDLVRNDLGKIARVGSVKVDHMFRAEVYSSLIHLMADISAEIKTGTRLGDVLRALLPGGSISGAPKRRAVEILEQVETTPRSVYTGYIGYVMGGRADFNIAIRTMVHRDGLYHIHAGGGIVADSEPESEYQEMLLKAQNLLRAVGADV